MDANGKRIDISEANKSDQYYCPVCAGKLRVREGQINIKHFSHISKETCDDFSVDMSEWHRKWQEQFPVNNREIIIEHNSEKHRADVLAYGHIIEFQHSPISQKEFERRNAFYTSAGKNVVWVFDLTQEVSRKQIFLNKEIWKGRLQGHQWWWFYSKRMFKHFAPHKQKNVILLFQFDSASFCETDKTDYLKRVIWAQEQSNDVSFGVFQTLPFPGNKNELLNWIKNRDEFDEKEQTLIKPPVKEKNIQKLSPAPTKRSSARREFIEQPIIPRASTIVSPLSIENMTKEDFQTDSILKDRNGNRVILCTVCNQIFRESDMSDYRYSKGVCRNCINKPSGF